MDEIRTIASDPSLSAEEKQEKIRQVHLARTQSAIEKYNLTQTGDKKSENDDAVPSCDHYVRNCSIVAKCCDKVFGCRLCHDEECDHKIDRFATSEMICRLCKLRQPVGPFCANESCSFRKSDYYCGCCKLWNDKPGFLAFHCDSCGICRVGLRSDYKHCDGCNLCLQNSLYEEHKCVDSNNDCPVCREYLQTSRDKVTLLRCGHAMHSKCHTNGIRNGLFYCPLCRKSFNNPNDYNYEALEAEIARNIMPEEYRNFTALISCNDCNKQTETSFHFMGHKCHLCNSFNTIMIKYYKKEEEQ